MSFSLATAVDRTVCPRELKGLRRNRELSQGLTGSDKWQGPRPTQALYFHQVSLCRRLESRDALLFHT